jgi:formate transporter
MGLTFCLGLILVVISDSELFTGNCLIIIAWASRKITTFGLLRSWIIVYLGNFVGSLGTAALVFMGGQYSINDGAIGEIALKIALTKSNLVFPQALVLGILCNALVCLAVWMTYSARSTTDKIMVIVFPITAFVAAGFEHSVANMYFIPYGLMIKVFDPAFAVIYKIDLTNLTWNAFLIKNLLPVTLGNIIGGACLVAGMYWFVYLKQKKDSNKATSPNLSLQDQSN